MLSCRPLLSKHLSSNPPSLSSLPPSPPPHRHHAPGCECGLPRSRVLCGFLTSSVKGKPNLRHGTPILAVFRPRIAKCQAPLYIYLSLCPLPCTLLTHARPYSSTFPERYDLTSLSLLRSRPSLQAAPAKALAHKPKQTLPPRLLSPSSSLPPSVGPPCLLMLSFRHVGI